MWELCYSNQSGGIYHYLPLDEGRIWVILVLTFSAEILSSPFSSSGLLSSPLAIRLNVILMIFFCFLRLTDCEYLIQDGSGRFEENR